MEKIDELMENLKGNIGGWEEEIFSFACSLAQLLAEDILKKLDGKLMQERDRSLKVVELSGRNKELLPSPLVSLLSRRRLSLLPVKGIDTASQSGLLRKLSM